MRSNLFVRYKAPIQALPSQKEGKSVRTWQTIFHNRTRDRLVEFVRVGCLVTTERYLTNSAWTDDGLGLGRSDLPSATSTARGFTSVLLGPKLLPNPVESSLRRSIGIRQDIKVNRRGDSNRNPVLESKEQHRAFEPCKHLDSVQSTGLFQ